jgi:hypothetical protein
MAVTFISQAGDYSPSDNPLVFVFNSNQTTQPNFSYIVQTYVNAVLVSTEKIFPERSGRSHWDASTVVKNVIYSPTRPTNLNDEINLPTIYVKVTENYGTTPTNQASADSSTITIFKAKLSEEDFKTIDIAADYVSQKWLTEIPNNLIHVTKTQDVFVQHISDDASQSLELFAFDIDGNLIDTYATTPAVVSMWNCNLSYSNLLAVMPAMTSAYEVKAHVNMSEDITIRYDITDCDNKDVLSWINKFGAFDQFVFTHYKEDRGNSESFAYQRQFGGWDGSNWSFDNDYGEIETVKMNKPTGYIVSGWLDTVTQNWLVSIYQSIGVRLNTNTCIKITSSAYTTKTQRFEELINEEITYQLTNVKSIMI